MMQLYDVQLSEGIVHNCGIVHRHRNCTMQFYDVQLLQFPIVQICTDFVQILWNRDMYAITREGRNSS
jgi:hypothetical protein